MKKFVLLGIAVFTFIGFFIKMESINAEEFLDLPSSDYLYIDYTSNVLQEKINKVSNLNDAILDVVNYSNENNIKYIIRSSTSVTIDNYFQIEVLFFENCDDSFYFLSYQNEEKIAFKWIVNDNNTFKYTRKVLYSSNGYTNISENLNDIKKFIDNPDYMSNGRFEIANNLNMNKNKVGNVFDYSKENYSLDPQFILYSNIEFQLKLKEDLNKGYNLPVFYKTENDSFYYQLVNGDNLYPFFQPEDSDNIPTDTDDEVFILDSDKYAYFSWIIEEEKVYDDIWFEMDDIGHHSVGEIKYEYHVKGAAEPVIKKITPKSGKFVEKFSKELFSKIDHFHLEIYIPFQVDNTKYKIIWRNGAIMNDEGQIQDNIFNLSNNPVYRGKYETVDLTNKYAAQLIFKKFVNPRFDYLEFHTLGEFNYYFKKQYGQSETVYDNSRVTDDVLDLTHVYFDNLEFIGGDELDSNISLFFVNNNFKKNNTIRTLLEYDSDMFDIVIFENEWDDKNYVTEDGDHITLKPPSNINPDGSEENNNLLDDISLEDILEHSLDSIKSIFAVFSLMGGFVTALLISLPPIFQTVLLWGFTVGIIVVVLKILL